MHVYLHGVREHLFLGIVGPAALTTLLAGLDVDLSQVNFDRSEFELGPITKYDGRVLD